MRRFLVYVRQTTIAGLLLLVPFLVILLLFEKLHVKLRPFVHRMSEPLGLHGVVASVVVWVLTVLVLGAICFAAGLVLRLPVLKAARDWLENNLLRFIPGYEYFRMLLAEKLGSEDDAHSQMVLVEIDGWQPAMLIEQIADGRCVVYVPGAPNAADGSVHILPGESVRNLDAPLSAVMKSLRFYGRGLGQIAGKAALAANQKL
jgi:uncharacterized membrane protein